MNSCVSVFFGRSRVALVTLCFLTSALTGCKPDVDYRSLASHVPFGKVSSSSGQTDVDRAQHLVDAEGVPFLRIDNVGKQRHPAWVALYALAYAGTEVYDERLIGLQDARKFRATIEWLEKNLHQNHRGLWVWEYHFDSTYNDISIKAPWSSAFAQATGIQALTVAYERTGESRYIELAKKAAQALFTPLAAGGFLFEADADIWFEEIPVPIENPGHILNGHMRVLLALADLHKVTNDSEIAAWLKRGTDTLYRWLPKFDTGYWLRYDLNPRKNDLLFRFANPYGFPNHALAIDKITLRDPVSNAEVSVDVGSEKDATEVARIAGAHWGQREDVAGRSARRLVPAALDDKPDELRAPHTYFYLSLPGEWKDNLRDQWHELVIEYYDDAAANITIQQRSIAPGQTFRDMRDGDLHLTGSGQWREWIVPLRSTDLGYWVGSSYANKHRKYLEQIAKSDKRLAAWAELSNSYANTAAALFPNAIEVNPKPLVLPKQTPMTPVYSLDKFGVVRQHAPDERTRLTSLHMFDPVSGEGVPVYSPYVISSQLLDGENFTGAIENGASYSKVHKSLIRREPALKWLLNSTNYRSVGSSAIYTYPFENAYNDVFTQSQWASAFGQAYVLKALIFAAEHEFSTVSGLNDAIRRSSSAFAVSIENGGITTLSRNGDVWFEEVPNATHVLNAHLISLPELSKAANYLCAKSVQSMVGAGIQSLRNKLHLFDTGYWLRYDQNPKKELLFQIDWLSGNKSPLIDEVLLQSPQTGRFVRVDLGQVGDFDGGSRISGSEWGEEQLVDGKTVRSLLNGYRQRSHPLAGGTRHNAYLRLALPEREFKDFFDVRSHRLIVRYKDISPGQFIVKIQSINEGNVLDFIPLRNAVISTTGDQQWKEAVVEVRPQDMGWYKGADYQIYEVEQLKRIAELSGDWFFRQYVQRQRYFLESKSKGQPTIIQPTYRAPLEQVDLSVLDASPTYEGFGFNNAIDGDNANNYVAGEEGEAQAYVTLGLSKQLDDALIKLDWESETNHAGLVTIFASPSDSGWTEVSRTIMKNGENISITARGLRQAKSIKIEFSDFKGQPRVLLRGIQVFALPEVEAAEVVNVAQRELQALLEGELFSRLKKYSASPLFSEMTLEDARHGTEGNCSHAAMWMAMKMSERGVPYRVLDIKSSTPDGQPLSHAMTEVKIGGKWLLTDPLNGWIYPASIVDLRNSPVPPINHRWPGRKGMEVYKEDFFFKNLRYVEAYEDLAYTGLFEPKRQAWRYDLIGSGSLQ